MEGPSETCHKIVIGLHSHCCSLLQLGVCVCVCVCVRAYARVWGGGEIDREREIERECERGVLML
jgi:hypothetical protein